MKKLKKDVIVSLVSNVAVAAVIICVFAFTLLPGPSAAITSGDGYQPYYSGDRSSDKISLMFNVYENGGELPAMVVTDCVARYVDGVLSPQSLVQESFSENLLEYPQYTRPVEYRGLTVPEVLRSGNHAAIDKWRRERSLEITKKNRPDLLEDKF